MATIPSPRLLKDEAEIDYPSGDGQPMGETPLHRDNLITAVRTLERYFADQPLVYVSGNMFVYYEKGNRHKHVPIEMVEGRLPSEVLGLHLERDGEWLRLYNPATGLWLPTPEEREAALERAHERAEAERQRAEADRRREQAERERAEAERKRLAAELQDSGREVERLRQELAEWRRRFDEK